MVNRAKFSEFYPPTTLSSQNPRSPHGKGTVQILARIFAEPKAGIALAQNFRQGTTSWPCRCSGELLGLTVPELRHQPQRNLFFQQLPCYQKVLIETGPATLFQLLQGRLHLLGRHVGCRNQLL